MLREIGVLYAFMTKQDYGSQFVGGWDEFEGLVDCDGDGLPEKILKANPGIKTFASVFGQSKSSDTFHHVQRTKLTHVSSNDVQNESESRTATH